MKPTPEMIEAADKILSAEFSNTLNTKALTRDILTAALALLQGEPVAILAKRDVELFDVNDTQIVAATLFPKGTLRPENEFPVYASPAPLPMAVKAILDQVAEMLRVYENEAPHLLNDELANLIALAKESRSALSFPVGGTEEQTPQTKMPGSTGSQMLDEVDRLLERGMAARQTSGTYDPVAYALQYGGRCRECADTNGLCPTRGLPCDPDMARKAAKHCLDAWAYGIEHGYIANPFNPLGKGRVLMSTPASDIAALREENGILSEALKRMENCYEQLAATRTHEIYAAMIDGGQADALLDLDNARRNARSALQHVAKGERGQ